MNSFNDQYQIVWLIRRLFRALSQTSNEMLEDIGINSAERAVMEFLNSDEEMSVPQIAKKYTVSRQHIQTTINGLLAKDLIKPIQNHQHKRSPLFSLTYEGKVLFQQILNNDKQALIEIFTDIADKNITVTRSTLTTLLENLTASKANRSNTK